MKSSVIQSLLVQIGAVFIVSSALIGYLWIQSEYDNLEKENQRFSREYLHNQKTLLRSEVKKVKQYLIEEKVKAKRTLEQTIRNRTLEAHSVALNIYNENRANHSDAEIQHMITSALRNIRFNNRRGYYFITSLNGIEHLSPIKPSVEGQHVSEVFSASGVKVVEDMIEIAKKNGEGFLRYRWPRPDDQTKDYLKYSFVKLFQPYGWIIGTGDYLAEVDAAIQTELFQKIARVKYGAKNEGYFFVNSYLGDLYVTNGEYFGGKKNIWAATDVSGKKVVQENARIAQSEAGAGFSEYVWRKPNGEDAAKISFIEGLDDWQIFIGTGAYIDTIESRVSERVVALTARMKQRITRAIEVLLGASLLVGLAMYLITKKLSLNFVLFQNTFERAADTQARIDTERVYFGEFKQLADRTNGMIDTLNSQAERLRYQAYYDHLTGLPNRINGTERLTSMIKVANRDQALLGLLFVDMDNFKEINDTLGHTVGDSLIQAVADRLKRSLSEEIVVVRLGGDEFAVMTGHLPHRDDAGKIAGDVLETLSAPFGIGDYELHITASIGISIYPNDGLDAETMLRNADSALYQAKKEGKNLFTYYHGDLTEQAAERLEMVDALRGAIKKEQFELYYQPQVDTRINRVIGAEALIRWRHPERGLISPDQFIPFSESSGQILAIGEWVLREACLKMASWRLKGYDLNYIAVNISGKQLQQTVTGLVRDTLEDTGLNPEMLELEITESVVMDNHAATIADLNDLKALGVGLSIDDFGTGYSSLSHLKQLPITKLKVDRSFVRDLEVNENDRAIVEAIIAMGRSLNLTVLAEGVENEAQLDVLNKAQCFDVQGYFFSRPLPEHEFLKFLDEV